MRHVLLPSANVPGGAGRYRGGLFLQQVVEHREVVHREVPDHVHVVLEQAEIHPRAVVVVDVAEIAGADDLADLLDRAGVDEGVVDHQGQVAARRFFDQPPRIVGGGGDRLFDDDVLAGAQRGKGQLVMRRDRRGDQHGIDGGVVDQRARILMQRQARDSACRRGRAQQPRSRRCRQGGSPPSRRRCARGWAPIAVADDTDTDHGAAIPVAGGGRASRSRTSPTTLAGTPATIA